MSIILGDKAKKSKKKIRKLNSVSPSRKDAKKYYDQLSTLIKDMQQTTIPLFELIESGASETELLIANEAARLSYENLIPPEVISGISEEFVGSTSEDAKKKLQNVFKKSFGVDVAEIIDGQGVQASVEASVKENVKLISSISEKYYSDIEEAVKKNFSGELEGTLFDRVKELGDITDSRARLIARDQTSKVVSNVTRARHQSIGIDSYRWRNSRDQRVVGNPSGLYPKGNSMHMDHWTRENKVFQYSNPPPDGNPGQPIQCRCVAEPILDIDDMNVTYV